MRVARRISDVVGLKNNVHTYSAVVGGSVRWAQKQCTYSAVVGGSVRHKVCFQAPSQAPSKPLPSPPIFVPSPQVDMSEALVLGGKTIFSCDRVSDQLAFYNFKSGKDAREGQTHVGPTSFSRPGSIMSEPDYGF